MRCLPLACLYCLQLAQAVAVHQAALAHLAAAQVVGVVQAHAAPLAAVALHCRHRGKLCE